MKRLKSLIAVLLCFSFLLQTFSQRAVSHADGFVVYQENIISEQKTEEQFIPEEMITQKFILENMTYEDELYEVKISEDLIAQAYTIELTVDVDIQTSMAGVIPPQLDEYDIDWPSVIAKFAVGTAIIVVVGVINYLTKGTSTFFVMATPGTVIRDALIGGTIAAALSVSVQEISQGGISSKAATKYAIEGFASGYMWGAISSVIKVTATNIKRLHSFKLATGGALKIKIDGTVLDAAGNVVGKAYYGNNQWYLVDAASNATKVFDKAGNEILDITQMELPSANSLPANSTFSVGAEDSLKVCYTDESGIIYRIGDDLIPNNVYSLGDKVYATDELGRIVRVDFESLSLKSPGRGRFIIADSMQKIAKGDALLSDQRGHLIADMFDGNNTLANIVPMCSEANQGTVKAIETVWAQTIQNGGNVSGTISISFDGSSFRPTSFLYSYDTGNGVIEQLIPNY